MWPPNTANGSERGRSNGVPLPAPPHRLPYPSIPFQRVAHRPDHGLHAHCFARSCPMLHGIVIASGRATTLAAVHPAPFRALDRRGLARLPRTRSGLAARRPRQPRLQPFRVHGVVCRLVQNSAPLSVGWRGGEIHRQSQLARPRLRERGVRSVLWNCASWSRLPAWPGIAPGPSWRCVHRFQRPPYIRPCCKPCAGRFQQRWYRAWRPGPPASG